MTGNYADAALSSACNWMIGGLDVWMFGYLANPLNIQFLRGLSDTDSDSNDKSGFIITVFYHLTCKVAMSYTDKLLISNALSTKIHLLLING